MRKHTFKKNDNVICIDPGYLKDLFPDETYIITNVYFANNSEYVNIITPKGEKLEGYLAERFKKIRTIDKLAKTIKQAIKR